MIIKPIPTSATDQTVIWQDEEANHRFILQARSVPLISTHQIKKLRRLSLNLVTSIGSSNNNSITNDTTSSRPTLGSTLSSAALPSLQEHELADDNEPAPTELPKQSFTSGISSPFSKFFPRRASLSSSSSVTSPTSTTSTETTPSPTMTRAERRASSGHRASPSFSSASDLFGNLVDSVQKGTASTQRTIRQLPSLNMSMSSLGSSLSLPSISAKAMPSSTALGKILDSAILESNKVSMEDATYRILLQCSHGNHVVAIAVDEATIRDNWDCIHKTVFPKVSMCVGMQQ